MSDAAFEIQAEPTGTLMVLFRAQAEPEGVRLRWLLGEALIGARVTLQRGPAVDGPWSPVDAEAQSDGDGFEVLDRSVVAGSRYYYRLAVVTGSGASLSFGPVAVTAGERITEFALSPVVAAAAGSRELNFGDAVRRSVSAVAWRGGRGVSSCPLAATPHAPSRERWRWPMPPAPPPTRSSITLASIVAALALSAGIASATPVLGFVEHFAGTSVGTWSSGNGFTNPGAGGALGAGDGFLLMTTPGQNSNLGATGTGPEYTGDWTAAGITGVRMELNDVGVDDPLEIHVSVGNTSNLWQYNTGFIPPLHAWSTIFVDLRSQSDFTQIIGLGTFAAAKAAVNRLLVRHDNAPYTMSPDPLDGDFGLDEVGLIDIVTGVAPGGVPAPQPVQLAMPYPNPSYGPVAIAFRTFDERPVSIEVVDVAGRMIRHTTLASVGTGNRIWTWDGLDDDGAPAAAGVYRVRAFDDAGGTSRPLIRLAH